MNWENIELQVSQLRQGLLEIFSRIETLSNQSRQYPQQSQNFEAAKGGVRNPMYDVVVCGEVKKGKSTLLNAIIGQDILPVDNEIATSQVFRITNSTREAYELVFNDGSRLPISRTDLSKYGSQVDINIQGEASFSGKILSYIQVYAPVAFLPENVSLVDTPGLGAIYKSHEWITQNYVKKAAAVLFIFDPRTPLVKLEQNFINKVLDVTPHIMFVMTKIDTVIPSEWTTQLRRTEEGLAEIFRSRNLTPPTVFPVSSLMLREAADEDELDFKMENMRVSMFPAIKEEMMCMIMRAIALAHTSDALYEAHNHVAKVSTYLNDMLKASAIEGQQLDQKFRNEKLALQARLQQEWGADSSQNKKLAENISLVCNNVTNRVGQIFRATSPIREHYINKIKNLKTLEEVEALGKSMPRAVVNDVATQWESIMSDAEREVAALISVAASDIDMISRGAVANGIDEISTVKLDLKQRLSCLRNDFFTNSFIGMIISVVIPPLGPIVAIGKTIWDFFTGGAAKEAEIERNKSHFTTELAKLMDKLNSQLCDVQSGHERSVVNEFIYTLKNSAEQFLARSVTNKKQEMQAQLSTFENQARKSVEEKKAECNAMKSELQKWLELDATIKQLSELRNKVQSEIK